MLSSLHKCASCVATRLGRSGGNTKQHSKRSLVDQVLETGAEFLYELKDGNTVVIEGSVAKTIFEFVEERRAVRASEQEVAYHRIIPSPRPGYPGFFCLERRKSLVWKPSPIKQEDGASLNMNHMQVGTKLVDSGRSVAKCSTRVGPKCVVPV